MKMNQAMPNLMIDGGIFKYLDILSDEDIDCTAAQMGVMYYFHSGDKTANSLVRNYTENGVVTTVGEAFIGNLINDFYGEDWSRAKTALYAEYNPIDNYDRTELTTDAGSGFDSTEYGARQATTGQQQNTRGGHTDTNTHSVAPYDSSTLVNSDQDSTTVGSATDTLGQRIDSENAHTDTYRKGSTMTRNSHISGNIGVTTTQQMIESELRLRALNNLYDRILKDVDKFLTLKVYE